MLRANTERSAIGARYLVPDIYFHLLAGPRSPPRLAVIFDEDIFDEDGAPAELLQMPHGLFLCSFVPAPPRQVDDCETDASREHSPPIGRITRARRLP
jgi:hypothetical protein